MKQFGKILKFELKGYLKNKVFVGITIFLVIAIAVAMFIPNISSLFKSEDGATDSDALPVMLVYADDSALSSLVKQYFDEAFTEYHITVAEGTIDDVKEQITSGSAECAFVMDSAASYTYYVDNLSMYDSNTSVANTVLQEVYRVTAMMQNGLTSEQVSEIMSVQIESNTTALGKDQMQNFFYTYIMIFALYMVILLYQEISFWIPAVTEIFGGSILSCMVITWQSIRCSEIWIFTEKRNFLTKTPQVR